ncbi:signal transduction histidine kinase/phage shock protein PspC (stress-responsive transcriptional regulator) [Kitasatospora gansuensis]|uniref:Signal transduction histidine kinase/phage shock protein PspC (Stress-responsive transcriptional regulator) n=1 Tax=Kitasatospora gansuensis TaxID=258050 RepID=A0A7W7WIZ8_9ACTN|nr:signal transduction histidine kinase/phage shock protein PspC (stress-responsive transcriptional regulator) [Kitasatospora gansuensis]
MAAPGTDPRPLAAEGPRTPDAPSGDLGVASPPYRRLYRSPHGRMLGGVAHGLALHLGLPVTWVRVAFVLLFFAQGIGVLLYAAFWFVVPIGIGEPAPGAGPRWAYVNGGFVPADAVVGGAELRKGRPRRIGRLRELLQRTFHGETAVAGEAVTDSRPAKGGLGQLLALLLLVVGIMALLSALHIQTAKPYMWPLLTVGVGVALVWRQADDSRWQRWFGLEEGTKRRAAYTRVGAGVLLVVAGTVGFLILQGGDSTVSSVIEAALAVLAGVLVLVGPYALRMWQDLGTERTARIRAQERAEIAAHVHDSVLHTLTLIQRNADDAKEVLRLARAQERELRLWLYRPEAAAEAAPDTLAERIRSVVAEVEDLHGVAVELVCVGDCPMDDRIAAQIQAAREATVNAAKYGGGGPVQVYAEVEGRTVSVFVRDHGPGFDPDSVPEDRMGVRESIIGRMKRNGGTARVRPAPDGGTEVELEMERAHD